MQSIYTSIRYIIIASVLTGAVASGAAAHTVRSNEGAAQIAQSQIGHRESPNGSNRGKQINKYFQHTAAGVPWSGCFVTWVIGRAGVVIDPQATCSVARLRSWAKAGKLYRHAGTPSIGDVIVVRGATFAGILTGQSNSEYIVIGGNIRNAVHTISLPKNVVDGYIHLPPTTQP